MTTSDAENTPAARKQWVIRYLANQVGMAPSQVSLDKGLGHYGLDSVDAMIMTGEMETRFGVEIDPAGFLEFDSVQEMLDGWDRIARPA